MTEDDLRNLFEQYGTVTSIKIVKDRETGRSKGFGFVEMENDTEAQNALSSLYDKEILGRKIVINEAQERPAKPGGGGGFKKRSFGGGGGGYNKGGGGGYRDRDRGGYNKRDYNNEY
jgi:RNA recognition motif-containing protein